MSLDDTKLKVKVNGKLTEECFHQTHTYVLMHIRTNEQVENIMPPQPDLKTDSWVCIYSNKIKIFVRIRQQYQKAALQAAENYQPPAGAICTVAI